MNIIFCIGGQKMKHIKIISILLCFVIITGGCGDKKSNNHTINNHTIIENITLKSSTYSEVKEVLPNMEFETAYNSEGMLVFSGSLVTEYAINNVDGKLRLHFNEETEELIFVEFRPTDSSKEFGDSLKTWLFEKYKDYEQTTKDTGFIFSNGTENIELYITENPIDNTKYHGLYIEWTLVE